MPQCAALEWFYCFFIFLLILWAVGGKLWFSVARAEFRPIHPNVRLVSTWEWAG